MTTILCYPEPVLSEHAEDVEEIDGRLVETSEEMLRTMYEARGLGLAGPQIGLGRRIVVANHTGEPNDEITVINPVIVEREDQQMGEEGCLSFPGIYTKIPRAARILVQAYDLDGNEVRFEAEGLAARLWQHEIDHLDGVLIVNRMTQVRRLAAARQLRDLERQYKRTHT